MTKTLVILGDPQVTTTPDASARRDAARLRQDQRQASRRGVDAGAAERLADDLRRSTASSTSSSPISGGSYSGESSPSAFRDRDPHGHSGSRTVAHMRSTIGRVSFRRRVLVVVCAALLMAWRIAIRCRRCTRSPPRHRPPSRTSPASGTARAGRIRPTARRSRGPARCPRERFFPTARRPGRTTCPTFRS